MIVFKFFPHKILYFFLLLQFGIHFCLFVARRKLTQKGESEYYMINIRNCPLLTDRKFCVWMYIWVFGVFSKLTKMVSSEFSWRDSSKRKRKHISITYQKNQQKQKEKEIMTDCACYLAVWMLFYHPPGLHVLWIFCRRNFLHFLSPSHASFRHKTIHYLNEGEIMNDGASISHYKPFFESLQSDESKFWGHIKWSNKIAE